MIKELNAIIGILIFLGSLCNSYINALPRIDDGYIKYGVAGKMSNRIPTADDVAEIWLQSNLNKTIKSGDQNKYDIIENGQPKVLLESFRINKNWMVKKYCIVSIVNKNCMEVGLNPTNESNTPIQIRLRANPKKIKKTKGFQMLEKEDELEKEHVRSQNHNLRKEQLLNSGNKMKRRSFLKKEHKDGKFKNDSIGINTRVKRDESDEVEDGDTEMEEDDEREEDEDYGIEEDQDYETEEDDEDNHDSGPSDRDSADGDSSDGAEDSPEKKKGSPFLDSNPSHSFEGSALEGSAEDSPHLWYNCRLPDAASNAEIMCTKWNDAVSCNLYCAHGHKFDEGIMRTTSCHFREGKWTKKFKQCEPFADCTLQLNSAGTLSCTTHRLKKGTTCRVSCDSYSKKGNTKSQTYHCDEHGRWTPSLPHCVENEGIDVVKPPSGDTATHNEFEYPKKYPF